MKHVKLMIALCIIFFITACSSTSPTVVTSTSTIAAPTAQASHPTPTLISSEDIFSNSTSGRIPVIYSHGGGPCDIGGMVFFAKHPQVDLIGLVLSRGEFYPQLAVKTWPIFLFDVLNSKSTAVGIGTETPLDPNPHEFPESWRGPSSNFWDHELPPQSTNFQTRDGYQLIIDLVNNSPDKVTIVAMGSMTDVALALKQDPGIIDNISHVVIMGGAFTVPGNLSDGPEPTNNTTAEWNMYIDATAAKSIFDSGVPVSIVPLDAIQYLVQSKDINAINTIDDPGVKYVAAMWNQQWGWSNNNGFLIWDTITATAVTDPENFHWVNDGVDVITEPGDFQGTTIPLNDGSQNIRYATGADYQAIMELLLATFRGDEEKLHAPSAELITELGGTWKGQTANFSIIFNLASPCELGVKCGTFEIPDFSLSGDVTFIGVDGNIYEFKTSNLSYVVEGGGEVTYEYLQVLPDGTLKYYTSGVDSGGADTSNEGILYRQ